MSASKQPRVVAELGRPETPAESAARRAESSANHRKRQTLNNLVYSLLATLGLVAIIVIAVPRATPDPVRHVDYVAAAQQGAGSEPDSLLAPRLPKGWSANAAQLRTQTADRVDAWYVGFVTPSTQYIGLVQGFDANDTWLASQLENSLATGTRSIGGLHWTVYDNRGSSRDTGNVRYALTTTVRHSTIALYGTAPTAEFDTLARAVASAMNRN